MGMLGDIGSALGGKVVEGAFNAWQNHEARTASEDMYRRRYQTMVTDLSKAGLNPMLAYMKDAGTPPTVGGATIGGIGETINQARQTSAQSSLAKIQEQNVIANTDLANANAAKVRAETVNTALAGKQIEAQTYASTASGQYADTQAAQLRALLPSVLSRARSDAEAAELLLPKARNMSAAEYSQFKREISPYLSDINSMANSANQAANAISPVKVFRMLDDLIGNDRQGPSGERYRSRNRR